MYGWVCVCVCNHPNATTEVWLHTKDPTTFLDPTTFTCVVGSKSPGKRIFYRYGSENSQHAICLGYRCVWDFHHTRFDVNFGTSHTLQFRRHCSGIRVWKKGSRIEVCVWRSEIHVCMKCSGIQLCVHNVVRSMCVWHVVRSRCVSYFHKASLFWKSNCAMMLKIKNLIRWCIQFCHSYPGSWRSRIHVCVCLITWPM